VVVQHDPINGSFANRQEAHVYQEHTRNKPNTAGRTRTRGRGAPGKDESRIEVGQTDAQAARSGNRHIGRELWHILKAAGFRQIDVEAVATHSAERGVEPFLLNIDPERMRSLVERGLLSEQDLERFCAALTVFAALPDAYTLWPSLMICGEKA
jgi:hypothetical protein